MKHLLACLAILAAFTAGAQSMPYNPDANDDGYIGAPDLLSFLPLYGTQLGIDSSLTCDYNGTTLETWLGDFWSENIVIDSVLVQYQAIDIQNIWVPGCPETILDSVLLERSFVLQPHFISTFEKVYNTNHLGYFREFRLFYQLGTYAFYVADHEIGTYVLDGFFPGCTNNYGVTYTEYEYIPLPNGWGLDSTGIVFSTPQECGWVDYCSYFRVLPFWHYAE